jgi:hypothetical protein
MEIWRTRAANVSEPPLQGNATTAAVRKSLNPCVSPLRPIEATPKSGLDCADRSVEPRENEMAKGQARTTKEKKKPKAEKKIKAPSAYQQQFGKTQPTSIAPAKK